MVYENKRDDLKEKILQESIKLFITKGFSGSSANELVRLAGVSKGTLYWHFKDRNDILYKIHDKYCDVFIEVSIRKINAYIEIAILFTPKPRGPTYHHDKEKNKYTKDLQT